MEHDGARQAEADVLATLLILDAQVERYEDLPRTAPASALALTRPSGTLFHGERVSSTLRKSRTSCVIARFARPQNRSGRSIRSTAPKNGDSPADLAIGEGCLSG
jgi:hypothetical protein